ncbi:hypothetical protein TorRG33x02_339700 [Trema orientale]|uniref:Uncharacterized protein n=1 Tax=Trema orientale TaxID=63057 RepID=A0A2P5AW22_TREOI|nr:hypothetical protein TorRG33x02_339700 [Trema orientale]
MELRKDFICLKLFIGADGCEGVFHIMSFGAFIAIDSHRKPLMPDVVVDERNGSQILRSQSSAIILRNCSSNFMPNDVKPL